MLTVVASLFFGVTADPAKCISYEVFPDELFQSAKAYLAGPPERYFELRDPEAMHELIAFLKQLGQFNNATVDDNSLILGFIELGPGGSRLVITETSILNYACSKKLSDEKRQTLMSILGRYEVAK